MAWTKDVRLVPGYVSSDPRPASLRTLDLAAELALEHATVAVDLSLGIRRPTAWWASPTPSRGGGSTLFAARSTQRRSTVTRSCSQR